jgi:hypothetical protein
MERRRFRSLPPRLELLEGLRRRLRGGVLLRLLLRVSRRSRPLARLSMASSSMSGVGVVPSLSRLRETLLRGVRLGDLEGDRDIELVLRRVRRALGGGEGLIESDVALLLDGLGERERELLEGVEDLRRGARFGLLPLPLPPRPR